MQALLVFRTEPLTAHSATHLGTWHNQRQLAEAGKQVAARHGVQIVDMYDMCFGLPFTRYLAGDGIHPIDTINYEVMNLLLNILVANRNVLP